MDHGFQWQGVVPYLTWTDTVDFSQSFVWTLALVPGNKSVTLTSSSTAIDLGWYFESVQYTNTTTLEYKVRRDVIVIIVTHY